MKTNESFEEDGIESVGSAAGIARRGRTENSGESTPNEGGGGREGRGRVEDVSKRRLQ